MVYFIADTHFGHENCIKLSGRPFSSIEEMDEYLIQAWNARVHGNDEVFVLGDMFFRCEDAERVLKQLKGRKRLLLGNHDGSWINKVVLGDYFVSVDTMLETSDGLHGLTLCHYPMLTWKHAKRSYMIHGHIHNDTSADFWPLLCVRDHVLNASVEINNYQPVTFDELLENNQQWKAMHKGDSE